MNSTANPLISFIADMSHQLLSHRAEMTIHINGDDGVTPEITVIIKKFGQHQHASYTKCFELAELRHGVLGDEALLADIANMLQEVVRLDKDATQCPGRSTEN